jgi:HK97 family phage major capsid protein
MSMTVAETRNEIKRLYEHAASIENRYPDGLTADANHDDFEEVKKTLTQLDALEDQLSKVEDAETRKARILDNQKHFSKPASGHVQPKAQELPAGAIRSFSEQFIESDEYKAHHDSGIWHNPDLRADVSVKVDGSMLAYLARKTLVYSGSGVGGPTIVNDRLPGVTEILTRELSFLDLIPTGRTTSNTVEYVEETTFTNNAAEVAEASVTTGTTGTKAESALAYTTRTSAVSTIAHWVPVTNAMLQDSSQIESVIRNRLLLGLNLRLETQLIGGDGNSPNLRGILNTTNVQTIGSTAGTSIGGAATVIDAAYAAMNQVMVTGLASPNGFVFHPNDFAAVRLARENAATGTLGGYLYGSPATAGPATLWGRPVVLSIGMTENTLLTGDFAMGCMLFDREQAAIRVGTINDQFVRNMQTILAEMRAAFVVFRPTAFCRVTGV